MYRTDTGNRTERDRGDQSHRTWGVRSLSSGTMAVDGRRQMCVDLDPVLVLFWVDWVLLVHTVLCPSLIARMLDLCLLIVMACRMSRLCSPMTSRSMLSRHM